MPREKQIIPKYTYPHEEIIVNDYSSTSIHEVAVDANVLKYLSVFASSRGIDRKLVYIDSLKAYYNMFGKTNFARFGQPHLMPTAYLQNQNVGVWCLRVTAKNSTYANSTLSLWYKEDVENKAFRIKFTKKSISEDDLTALGDDYLTALTNREMLEEVGAMLDGPAVNGKYTDDEGYTQVPIATFTASGHGVYGNHLRWRITPDQDYEKEYKSKFYIFEILDVTQGVTVAQHNSATIVSNPNFENGTLINDVIDDMDDSKRFANITVYDANIEALYETYVNFCDKMLEEDPTLEINIPDIYTFDPFFGKELKVLHSKIPADQPFIKFAKKMTPDVDLVAVAAEEGEDGTTEGGGTTEPGSSGGSETPTPPVAPDPIGLGYTNTDICVIDSVIGNTLLYGSDGDFADTDVEKRNAAIDEQYVKAFSGDIDKLILSHRRIPVATLYDANYSMPVKVALARLALHRFDAPLHLDVGIRSSIGTWDIKTMEADFTEIYEMVEDFENLNDEWPISINAQHYQIKEPSTGKRVTVTMTYYLAMTDSDYLRVNSQDAIPRTGSNATLSGHVKNSLYPAVDESDKDIKQALVDTRINYFEAVGENVFERGTDHTFIHPEEDMSHSDLGVENNVIALFSLKRILENEFRTRRNQITTPERRKDFREYLLAKYAYLNGHVFDSFDIRYKQNEWEAKRSITHVYAAVRYFPRGEITLIEIDVNEKTYKQDIED